MSCEPNLMSPNPPLREFLYQFITLPGVNSNSVKYLWHGFYSFVA
jgi:hypothetical protein